MRPRCRGGVGAAWPRATPSCGCADVWRRVLQLPETAQLSVEHEFVAVGGHSLQQIRLAAELSRAFQWQVPVADVLRRATIEEQAQWMERAAAPLRARRSLVHPPDCPPAGLSVSVASAAQQRFYLEEQRTRTAEVSAYAIMLPFLVACLGSVDDTLRRVEGRVPGGGGAAPSAAHCPVRDEQSGALHQRVLSMDECGM